MINFSNPSFFGVGIIYALVFLILALLTDAMVNALLLLGLMVGFSVGKIFHLKGYERAGVHFGVACMILYQSLLLYAYRDVPNIGLIWFIAGPVIIARVGRAQDILIWTPISVIATVVCFGYVAQYPVMQHPMSLANLLGVLTLAAVVSYFFVSEKEKKEAELMQSLEGAEHAEQRSTRFLATLSHELRTPMTSILLSAETLRASDNLDREDKAAIERLYSAASVTTNVINDVLELAKVEANLSALVREPFCLEDLLEELKTTLTPLATSHGCRLLFLPMPDSPAHWHSSIASFRQILGNLIGNAIKHSPNGHVAVSFVRESEYLDIFVRDTGSGIAVEHQEAIFEPFISMSGTSSVGTGLGLTLARGYAERMGCEVNLIASVIDEGSVFSVRVPRDEYYEETLASTWQRPESNSDSVKVDVDDSEQAAWVIAWCDAWQMNRQTPNATYQVTNAVFDLPSLRLALGFEVTEQDGAIKPKSENTTDEASPRHGVCLICDDNELVRQVFSVILTAAGYEVETVGDEAQALNALATKDIDFMILDVQLEHSSGVDLLSRVRAMNAGYANIPVCMISGSLDGKEQAGKVGADHYLLKPPTKNDLELTADKLMQLSMQRVST